MSTQKSNDSQQNVQKNYNNNLFTAILSSTIKYSF